MPRMADPSEPPMAEPADQGASMIGKKVQVFWPVDESYYTGTVYEYDPASGEHLVRYEDGDAEWLRLGENDGQGPPEVPSVPETPSLDTPQASPDRPMDGGMPQLPPQPGAPPALTYYTQHGVPVYSPQSGGGHPGNVPGVVYAMYPPPHGTPHRGEYPPPPHQIAPHAPPLPASGHDDSYRGGGGPPPPQHQPPSNDSRKKSGPKAWTKEEDATLLRLVQSMQMPMKWSVVATNLPGRTGKQCRERYVNHLNPRLKTSDWNPVEDSTIFHLYSTTGSHWSSMSKVIPGRTDNGIKNRYHNLRRQVERDDENRQKKAALNKDYSEDIRQDLIRPVPEALQGKFDSLWDFERGLPMLASETVVSSEHDTKNYFGPFVQAREGQVCVRCGFLLPSVQTGREVCEKTGWCLPCALLPPQLSGNMLRECLSLRREKNLETRQVMEGWDLFKTEHRQDEEEPTAAA